MPPHRVRDVIAMISGMRLYEDRILPRLLDLAMRSDRLAPYRQRAMARANGRVLEIGRLGAESSAVSGACIRGCGTRFACQAPGYGARQAMRDPFHLCGGVGRSHSMGQRRFDTVVSTWTLCSIPGVAQALREVRRVLRPGGRFLFVEHGLAPDADASVRRWQNRLTPAWRRVAGGCHLNRAIPEMVEQAGFEIGDLATSYAEGPRPMTFTYEGWASVRPAD